MLHVTPGIVERTKTKVSLVLIANVSAKIHRMPKQMVSSSRIKPPLFIANVDDTEVIPVAFLERTDSIVAAVQNKPKMKREDHVEQHEKVPVVVIK